MFKKSFLATLLIAISATSSPLQAFTHDDVKDFCEVSGNLAMLQDLAILLAAGCAKINKKSPNLNRKYQTAAIAATYLVQVPHDISAAALESNKNAFMAFCKTFTIEKINGGSPWLLGLEAIVDSVAFNHVNHLLFKRYPNASDETKRRLCRVAYVTRVRFIMLAITHGIIDASSRGIADDPDASMQSHDIQHFNANMTCAGHIAYHVFLEYTGSIVADMIEGSIRTELERALNIPA